MHKILRKTTEKALQFLESEFLNQDIFTKDWWKKKQLTWTHVISNPKGWNSFLVCIYDLTARDLIRELYTFVMFVFNWIQMLKR